MNGANTNEGIAADAADLWNTIVLGNPVSAWVIASITAALVLGGFIALRAVLVARFRKAQMDDKRLATVLIRVIEDLRWWVVVPIALHAGAQSLVLQPAVAGALKGAAVIAAAVQVLLSSRLLVDFGLARLLERHVGKDGKPDSALRSASGIIRFSVTLVLGSLLLLLVLANLGVEITPLITGLGIGGVAVALASQSILADLFSSLSIVFDKPFLVGDFIVVGEQMGTVENIGVKTTRVRALSGEELVFTNADLLQSRIQNFRKLTERRVVRTFGVTYETPIHLVQQIPGVIKAAISHQSNVRIDRAHFKEFGAYSLDFEYVYFVLTPDFNTYMNVQEQINLELMREFARMGIEFAYPTQVEIHRVPAGGQALADGFIEGVTRRADAGRGAPALDGERRIEPTHEQNGPAQSGPASSEG